MHATFGCTPKRINGPTTVSPLQSGSNDQQTVTSIPFQAKRRKMDEVGQGSEPVEQECPSKAEHLDSALLKSESILKFEISRITENGGLVKSEGVEKLVQLMQPNRVEKKLKLVSRSLFAGVIAATENFDCLTCFVQLKGLPILDQWLQDVHKGKVGDGSPKDGDKSEEFLFILLRALDKLPVNLHALQMWNIGKSVNHLRTSKNSEIMKRAISLVDKWKKHVETEMNVDMEYRSWPKRDQADQGPEPFKRERPSKADDRDSALLRSESSLKFEISRITEKDGLVDSDRVEKLIQLMQPNRVEKKLKLVSRSMFAGVIAATENFDCLTRFVQLKGLPVLDQWLQDVHKGKVGDGSPKDGDKSEEFLFILLHALDKLPVNLHALQMCNIGKSVNHLRTYKNSEINKKARSLVDTWKKRVEAEMNVDTKSGLNQAGSNQGGSWPSRHLPEGSNGGNRQHCGPSETAIKSPTHISLSKPVQVEMSTKLAPSSPVLAKVVPSPAVKDGQPRSVVGSNPDLPSATARNERSSSSSQSHNSRSCSSEHAKTPELSGKEDARSSTAGSISVNMASVGGSRPRRSGKGHPGSAPSGSPRETGSSRNPTFHKNLASEKLSKSGLTCEKTIDLPTVDGSNQKIIVKVPSRGRSPSQSAGAGPIEDPTVVDSRASTPVLSEKNDQSDPDSKEKDDGKATSDVKTESWQSNDFKDILTCSDEGNGSLDATAEGFRNGDGDVKLVETSKGVSHPLENELESRKLHDDASFSSINALIESCVKFCQANAPMSGGDDGGMNLLASVAAGEMSKSNLPSPNGSSEKTSISRNESGMDDSCRSTIPNANDLDREQCQLEGDLHGTVKQGNLISVIPEQATEKNMHDTLKLDPKIAVKLAQPMGRSDEIKDIPAISSYPTSAAAKFLIGDESKQLDEKAEIKTKANRLKNISSMDGKVNDVASLLEVKKEAAVGVPSNTSLGADGNCKAHLRDAFTSDSCAEQKPYLEAKLDAREGSNGHSRGLPSKRVKEFDGVKVEDKEIEALVRKRSFGPGTSNALPSEGYGDRKTCAEAVHFKESESFGTNTATKTSHVNKKPKFDLNEGFGADDGKSGYPMNFKDTGFPISAHIVKHLPFRAASVSRGLPASVTVAAAAKGPFVPPLDLLRSKRELGWKGSAATSAFRPAEPRKALEISPVVANAPDAGTRKHSRPVFDFDLNVADERMVEDVAIRSSAHETASTSAYATSHDFSLKKPPVPSPLPFSGALDLDLNRLDEAGDIWQGSASSGRGLEVPFFPPKSSLLSGHHISEPKRDFDLNDGPVLDEAVEPSLHNQHGRSNIQSQPFVTGLRTSTDETGNFSSWYPAGNAFPPVTMSSMLSDRSDQPFPIIAANGPPRVSGPPTGSMPFNPEFYQGSVLSSSPAVPFQSFQYPVFPFGTGFPLPPASLSGVSNTYTESLPNGRIGFAASNSQLLSVPLPAGTSHFPRPYVVTLPDGSNSMSIGNSSKWGMQGLDLNAGPGTVEMDTRDETSQLVSRQLSVASSQALADEQGRMFQQMAGGILERKENGENIRYIQPSWQ